MTNKNKKRQYGFTIVELLIVIVVIGILAAFAVMSLRGAQVNARNTDRLTAARAYINILAQYKADNDTLPNLASGTYACLGEGFPDIDSDGSGDCYDLATTGTPYNLAHENAAFTAIIKAYNGGTLPQQSKVPVPGETNVRRLGPVYNKSAPEMIVALEGTTAQCNLPNVRLRQVLGTHTTMCYVRL